MDRTIECKIMNLQAKLKADNEASQRENLSRDLISSPFYSPRHGSGRRPKELGDIATPTRSRKQLDLPVSVLMQPRCQDSTEVDSKMKEIMKMNGILNIKGKKYHTDIKDLEHLGELGNGTCGHVVRMFHKPSETIIAVKQMRRSGNSDENKRIIMDLDVVFKSLDCPYIVRYLGCFITESDVWICMELMATCFDRLLKKLQIAIPEDILGKVTLATVNALHYLKESHGVIHRDVKPSNILLDEKGNVKLCDFGISGRLVDSKARTKNAGCAAYMAPERIEPPDPRKPDYDIRADVWSLGITLVELATGVFPYKDCKCDFEVLSRVLNEDPPSLPSEQNRFTPEFQSFVSSCLTKDYNQRPKYQKLLDHPFLKRYKTKHVDVAAWYAKATSRSNMNTPLRFIPTSLSTVTRRQPPPPPPLSHQSRRARTGLESIVLNGDQSTQYSTFRSLGVDELHLNELDYYKHNGNKYCEMPSTPEQHKRYTPESSYITNHNSYNNHSNNNNNNNNNNNINNNNNNSLDSTTFLVLPQFHQTSQPHNYLPTSYPKVPHYRSASLSPSRRYLTENKLLDHSRLPTLEDNGTHNAHSKWPFASLLKLQQNAVMMDDTHRRSPPAVPPRAPPSPPPRLNRISPVWQPSSPLLSRRTFHDSPNSPSTVRRLFSEGSPSLSRKMSPCPPQPPPRRLSESSSIPGSPQHFMNFRRNDLIRNTLTTSRFQMTPQPRRKAIYQMNDL